MDTYKGTRDLLARGMFLLDFIHVDGVMRLMSKAVIVGDDSVGPYKREEK